jgi:DNA-directed RNA polymerase specialized sigma24 family protein
MTWENVVKRILLRDSMGKVSMSLASKVIWRDVAMTPHPMPIDRLAAHLALLSRTKAGAELIAALVDVGVVEEGCRDLGPIIRASQPIDEGRYRQALATTAFALAPTNQVAALVVIMVLRPDLQRLTRRLARTTMDLEEAQADVVAVAWQLITQRIKTRHRVDSTLTLIDATWNEIRREAGLRRGRVDQVPLGADLNVAAPESDRLQRWPGLLAAGVSHGVLTPRQVVIIGQTRMDGRPLHDVARDLGHSYDAVRKERQRAERALRAYALSYLSEESE